MRVTVDTFQVSFLFFLQRLIKRLPVNLPRVEFMNRKRERAREREGGGRTTSYIFMGHFYASPSLAPPYRDGRLRRGTDGRRRRNTARSISFPAAEL